MLGLKQYVVKERVGMMKLTDTYDVLNPEDGQQIGIAQERPSAFAKWGRLLINKQLMPTRVDICAPTENDPPVLTITRGVALFRSKVSVHNAQGEEIGTFRAKVFSLGGAFDVLDSSGQKVAQVKGDWKGWNFKFVTETGEEIGQVTKKWAGMGKELFTSADTYMINLNGVPDGSKSALLLAAGLAIDILYKESK